MQRRHAFVAVFATAVFVLSGCGADDDNGGSTGDHSGHQARVIDITIKDGAVTPNGKRVDVDVDQEIQLKITADAPGEIHVHSTPEHEFEYDAGTTTETFTIDQPGVVDVESHTLEKIIVQLEVR